VMTHGALGDPRRYITHPDQAAQQLDRLRVEQPDAWLVLLGHTHVPMAVAERAGAFRVRPDSALVLPPAERVLLNPGAVGQARQRRPYGSALVLDGDARVVTLRRFPCDTQAGRRALAARGLDAGSFHRPPSWRKRLKARARAARRTRSPSISC
jgi:predicted phosphodiesterase